MASADTAILNNILAYCLRVLEQHVELLLTAVFQRIMTSSYRTVNRSDNLIYQVDKEYYFCAIINLKKSVKGTITF